MGKGRIPKDLLYGELEKGTHKTGCPVLQFQDVCRRDVKSAATDKETWDIIVKDGFHMAASCKRESSM